MRIRSTPCTKSPSASSGSTVASASPGDTGRRLETGSCGAEQRTQPPAADLDRQHAAIRGDGRARQRGRDRALANPALAGHHDQPLRGEGQARGHGAS